MIHKTALIALSFLGLSQVLTAQNTPPPSDHNLASSIKPQGTYLIEQFFGAGAEQYELSKFSCLKGTETTEKNTHWFRFKTPTEAKIGFTIAPLRVGDDLDFALYAQNEKGENQEIRCSAQGRQLGNTTPNDLCLGSIGLSLDANNNATTVPKGCSAVQHFLSALDAKPSQTYFLMVHNYSSAQGFTLTFGQQKSLSTNIADHSINVGDLFPNPAQTEAFLPIVLPNAAQAELLLLRANGQVLSRQTLDFVAGQQQLRIALPQQNSELLYVRLLLDGQVYHRKVVLIR
jgi:hypothetical protein